MRRWLLTIAHKCLPPRRDRRPARAGPLRVERLEERAVPAAPWDEVNAAVAAALPDAGSAASVRVAAGPEGGSVSVSGLSRSGLERLLAALRRLPVDVAIWLPPPSAPASSPGPAPGETGPANPPVEDAARDDFAGGVLIRLRPPPPGPASGTGAGGEPGGPRGGPDAAADVARSPGQPPESRVLPSGPAAMPPVPPEARGGAPGDARTDPAAAVDVAPGRTAPPRGVGAPAVAAGATPGPAAGDGAPQAARPTPLADLPDGALLRRFAAGGEQPAFAALARRHEPAVLRICAEVLRDADRARDAAQATLQALARRAGALDGRGPLAGWLSTVAYHMALRYRADDARRRQLERAAAERAAGREPEDPTADLARAELRAVVGEELDRLPAKYRLPLVLHYLEGRTHAEVARAAGLPRGSVARRLEDALGLLRDRLTARGFPF